MRRIRILLLCMALCLTACTVRIPEAAVEPTAVPEEATAAPEEATAVPEEPGEAPETGAFNTEMMFSGTTFDGEPIDQMNRAFEESAFALTKIPTIHVEAGSAAEKWAIERGWPYTVEP